MSRMSGWRCRSRDGGLQGDRGAVAIMVAIFMFLAVVLLAFVVDRGLTYVTRVRVQNAVDAAALAAVRDLCDSTLSAGARVNAAKATAVAYGARNGVTILDQDMVVRVGAKGYINLRVNTIQNMVFGTPTTQRVAVSAQATASRTCVVNYAMFSGGSVVPGGNVTITGDIYSAGPLDLNGSVTLDGDVYVGASVIPSNLTATGAANSITGNAYASGTIDTNANVLGTRNPGATITVKTATQVATEVGLVGSGARIPTDQALTAPSRVTVAGDCNLGNTTATTLVLQCTGTFTNSGALKPALRTVIADTIELSNVNTYGNWGTLTPFVFYATGTTGTAIDLQGNSTINGYLYAPNGGVTSGGGGNINGRIITKLAITGAGNTDASAASGYEGTAAGSSRLSQ